MIQPLLNLFAPDDCLQCGSEGAVWCEWCRLELTPLPSRCFSCHAASSNYDTCGTCRRRTGIARLYVITEYKDTAKLALQALKFDCKRQAATPLAQAMADQLPYYQGDEVVVAVPTAPVRVRQRGFDHTALLAKQVAAAKNLQYKSVLRRRSNTRQVGASRQTRLNQVVGAYRVAHPGHIKGKKVLLIDDVVTTGATLGECIKTLKQAGAKSVEAAVFAYSK